MLDLLPKPPKNSIFFLAKTNFFVFLPRKAERKRPSQRKRILRFVP